MSDSALTKYLSRKSSLEQKKDENNRKIRDLGLISEDALTKYTSVDNRSLIETLHRLQERLKKFAHVNKSAVEQFNEFTKQKSLLTEKKKELDESAKASSEALVLSSSLTMAFAYMSKTLNKLTMISLFSLFFFSLSLCVFVLLVDCGIYSKSRCSKGRSGPKNI